mmetsp:Transcript_42464/g.79489  ORF Transcript_42464/g.79489 Transcript_42464/m.79489 type:complete len:154 (-) Transcript_42464:1180-1641(-)
MLTNMGLYQNRLTGTMPSILATLTSLITLDLSINELSGTIPKEWATLTNLRYMSLYHNQLVGTVPNELAKLSKLSFMYLCHNALLCGNIPMGLHLESSFWACTDGATSTTLLSSPCPTPSFVNEMLKKMLMNLNFIEHRIVTVMTRLVHFVTT